MHDAHDTVREYMTPAEPEGISPFPTDFPTEEFAAPIGTPGDEFSLQQMYAEMEQAMIEQGATAEDLAEFRSIEGEVTEMIDSSMINGEIDPNLFEQNMNSYLNENGIDPDFDGF
jgi:hypothetical protein